MPVSVKFENDGVGVVMTAYGNMQTSDFFEANAQVYAPEVKEKLRYQIVDVRGVENVDSDWEKLKQLAETDKSAAQSNPGLKIAIITNPGILEALAQVYQRMATDTSLKTQIFRNENAARQWISDCIAMERSA